MFSHMTPTEYLQRFDPSLLGFMPDPPDFRSEEFWLTCQEAGLGIAPEYRGDGTRVFHPALLGWCFAVEHPALLPPVSPPEAVQSGAPEEKTRSKSRSKVEQTTVRASFAGRSSVDVVGSLKKPAKGDRTSEQPASDATVASEATDTGASNEPQSSGPA